MCACASAHVSSMLSVCMLVVLFMLQVVFGGVPIGAAHMCTGVCISVAPQCLFAMQHLKRGTCKPEKSPRHSHKFSRIHRRNVSRCHTHGGAVHVPTPVPRCSKLAPVRVARAFNIEFRGSGVRTCRYEGFGLETAGAFFSGLPVSASCV